MSQYLYFCTSKVGKVSTSGECGQKKKSEYLEAGMRPERDWRMSQYLHLCISKAGNLCNSKAGKMRAPESGMR